jgi:cell division protein FtsW
MRNRRSLVNNSLSDSGAVRRHKPDYYLLVIMFILLAFGFVVVYSISPGLAVSQNISQSYFITKQIIDVIIGLFIFAVAAYLPTKLWLRISYLLVIAALVGSLIVMISPVDEIYQAHRWIRLGSFSFQVAELIKLALLVSVSGFLAEKWRQGGLKNEYAVLKPLVIILVLIGLVVAKFQSDLGSAAVMVAMLGLMTYAVGLPMKKLLLIGGLILIIGTVAILSSSYRRERLNTFLHPNANCQASGYQACQALISVGSGGLFGLGLGYSVQAYGYQPEASNDSIFAIIAEKFGFIGSVTTVIVYGLLITRLKRVIERTPEQFSRLIVVGVLAWLSTQMIINIGAMLGLLPLKGITLPLISQGGTSLIFLMAALGIVFHISRYTSYNAAEPNTSITKSRIKTDNSTDGRGVRGTYNTSIVSRPRY